MFQGVNIYIECDCVCISCGVRIDLQDIYHTGKNKNNLFNFILLYVQLLLIISCQKFGLMISRLVLKTEKCVHNYIKSGFSHVHIVSPIAVSKSFPYNLDIESNKSMCTVRLVSQIDIKWTVKCAGN